MNAVSYSLFGANKERRDGCFDFHSYMRGIGISIRMNRLIYPGWTNIFHVDVATYEMFKEYFEVLAKTPNVLVMPQPEAPLCLAMLWRLKPCFNPAYSYVICRDIESPSTYREAQCVQQWINHDKAAHAITDSVSHVIPLMGGMIGFVPKYFTMRTGWNSWEEMISGKDCPWDVKGTDQEFLNRHVYPAFAQPGNDSITQHYLKGMGNTFLSDYHNSVPDTTPPISDEMKESNSTCGHIGAAGFYEPPTFAFLNKYREQFNDLREIEAMHKDIFYWNV